MKTLHVLAAAVLIAGTGSALAEGGADGQSDNAWLMQPGTPQNTMGQIPAPRPYASAPTPSSASAPTPAAGSDEKPSNAPRATSDSDEVMLP